MRILLIANIYPFEIGGAEVQARNLAESWIQQGHQVTIAGNRIPSMWLTCQNDTSKCFQCISIPTIKTNRATRATTYALSLLCLILRYRKENDLIYCRGIQDAFVSISFFKKIKILNLPLFGTSEGSGVTGDANFFDRSYAFKKLIPIINENCNAINIISLKIKQELIDIGFDEKKFSYIPNGVRTKKKEYQKVKFSGNKVRKIIFIGRLCTNKGVDYLLKSIFNLITLKDNLSISVTIIGYGPAAQGLMDLSCKMKLTNIVSFLGKKSQEDIFQLLSEHDIFVLPSLFEGLPVSVIEAMAAGLPVVVTRCGGPEDFVDDSVGRVVKAGDADSLTQALQEMIELSDEELQVMGQAARERVKNNFDIDVIADKYIQLFKQHI